MFHVERIYSRTTTELVSGFLFISEVPIRDELFGHFRQMFHVKQ